jgi:oxygen-dependent protoporphyrinogen oxidase
MRDALVLGGGLAGLACAHAAHEAGVDVGVLEAGDRAGGVVGTHEVGGFRFEAGPNTVQAGSHTFREIAGELGIEGELIASSDSARTRWLWHRGKLRALPGSPPAFLASPLFGIGSKLRLATEPLRRWRPPAASAPEPTLAEVLTERLGRQTTDLLAGAFVRGIYAGDHRELGARSAFPRLWRLLEEHGGLVRGMLAASRRGVRAELPGPDVPASRLLSFEGGLGRLVEAFGAALGDRLQLKAEAVALEREADHWRVTCADGARHQTRRVVLALPARATARLLEGQLGPEQLRFLRDLPHASVRLAHLGFAPGELRLPQGFGYLVPPLEGGRGAPRCLGTIFASNLFPRRAPAGGAAVSAFYALDGVRDLDDSAFADLAASDLARALGLERALRPARSWTLEWRDAICQYRPGHDEGVRALEADLARNAPGLAVAGAWTHGVSVEQTLHRGRSVGQDLGSAAPAAATRP